MLGQWRELNSIYAKQDKHILINFVYEYPKKELLVYSQFVLQEMNNRGYKYNLKNYYEYFKDDDLDQDEVNDINGTWLTTGLFDNHMNYTYLKICCWNLYEKILRGQKGFEYEAIRYIEEHCFSPKIA